MSSLAIGTPVGTLTIVVENGLLTAVQFGADPETPVIGTVPTTGEVATALDTERTGDLDDLDAYASGVVTAVAELGFKPEDTAALINTAVQFGDYFAGLRRVFSLPVAYARGERVRDRAQRRLSLIGYGKTATYGEIAEAIGNPKAARAVGSACAKNPLPIVVPCHRVLPSGGSVDGNIGGYAGGPDTKRALLRLERMR